MAHFLILPIGPPGAGKSTLARALLLDEFIDTRAAVSPDDFRRRLTGDKSSQVENANVFLITNTIVQTRLRHGLDVYVDATNLYINGRSAMLEWAEAYGAEVIFVKFDVPFDELRRRNEHRPDPVPDDVLKRFYQMNNDLDAQILSDGLVVVVNGGFSEIKLAAEIINHHMEEQRATQ